MVQMTTYIVEDILKAYMKEEETNCSPSMKGSTWQFKRLQDGYIIVYGENISLDDVHKIGVYKHELVFRASVIYDIWERPFNSIFTVPRAPKRLTIASPSYFSFGNIKHRYAETDRAHQQFLSFLELFYRNDQLPPILRSFYEQYRVRSLFKTE